MMLLAIVATVSTLTLKAQSVSKDYYIVVTTMHAKQPVDNASMKSLEQEYYDKVTNKNNLIIGSEIMSHYFTENSSEILLLTAYNTWEDIEKAEVVTTELIAKGWPDENDRKAFFDNYNNLYTGYHSDEIYKTLYVLGKKDATTTSKKPLVIYVRNSELSFNGQEEQVKAYIEYNEKVTLKNPYLLGYYPQMHSWGADSRDFLEYFYYNSLTELDNANAKEEALIIEAWPDETKRKSFMDTMNKGFTGRHGDNIYHNETTMIK